ncbi:hypothetical protein ABDK00_012075 [Niabella insulamsoli]|uniref:hypothetical protein n=1 Tax=Niabella insulamsoli TaxID=3144874 RepID=UPI0031FD15CD
MRVNKKEAKLLNEAIEQWQKDQLLDEEKAVELKSAVKSYRSDFDTLAFYASIGAVSCALLAFGALVLDEKWIERLRQFFAFSELIIGVIFALLALLLTWVARKRKARFPDSTLANESFTVLIALSAGVSVAYFTRSWGASYQSYGAGIFITALLYGLAAVYLDSKILWAGALLALISSWGVQTYAWSDDADHSYFLGMNYPLRMAFFGALLVLLSTRLPRFQQTKNFYDLSWYGVWIFFLLSGLVVSVSGNLSYDVWTAIRQGKLFIWAIAYTLLLIGLLLYAIKQKDETLRDIVIIFFLLNIYTRYFEYFWDRTNKGLFFALLALSFWLIGNKAEQVRKKLSNV